MRPPIGDALGKDRPQHFVRPDTAIKAMHQPLDHRLIYASTLVDVGREGGPPVDGLFALTRMHVAAPEVVFCLQQHGITNKYSQYCFEHNIAAPRFGTVTVMRLTAFTDFGLRALMRLAAEPERVITTDEIAREYRISRNHLVKVVRQLAEAGLVVTTRGGGGGMRLARPADEIRLGEVVRQLEGRHALVECFRADGGDCVLTPSCQLKTRLARAADAFLADLDRSTLADCIAQPDRPNRNQAAVAGQEQ